MNTKTTAILTAVAMLVACGGGGGDAAPGYDYETLGGVYDCVLQQDGQDDRSGLITASFTATSATLSGNGNELIINDDSGWYKDHPRYSKWITTQVAFSVFPKPGGTMVGYHSPRGVFDQYYPSLQHMTCRKSTNR
jgi:hypothetical protein